jgi:hypothetical protein
VRTEPADNDGSFKGVEIEMICEKGSNAGIRIMKIINENAYMAGRMDTMVLELCVKDCGRKPESSRIME